MQKISKKQALKKIFSKNKEEIEKIINNCEDVKKFKEKDIIFNKDDPLDTIYILLKGEINCRNSNDLGDEVSIDILSVGDVLGYVEYLAGIDHITATLDANSEAYLYKISLKEFDVLIKKDAYLCYETLVNIASQAHINMQIAETYRIFDTKDVIGRFFYEKAKKHTPYICEYTRYELSKVLHINLRTLYRYLDKLAGEGYLYIKHGKIHVNENQYNKLSSRYSKIVL